MQRGTTGGAVVVWRQCGAVRVLPPLDDGIRRAAACVVLCGEGPAAVLCKQHGV